MYINSNGAELVNEEDENSNLCVLLQWHELHEKLDKTEEDTGNT